MISMQNSAKSSAKNAKSVTGPSSGAKKEKKRKIFCRIFVFLQGRGRESSRGIPGLDIQTRRSIVKRRRSRRGMEYVSGEKTDE